MIHFLDEEIIRKTNKATRHLAIYNQAWQKICGLELQVQVMVQLHGRL